MNILAPQRFSTISAQDAHVIMFLKCPSCSKALRLPDSSAGKTVHCPECKSPISVPNNGESNGLGQDLDNFDIPELDNDRNAADDAAKKRWAWIKPAVALAFLVSCCGGGVLFLGSFRFTDSDFKSKRAKMDVRTIEKACQGYRLENESFPLKLQDLITGPKPYLENGEDAITDPWGRPYQYDPSGKHSDGKKPDVWTNNPNSGDTIGNRQSTRNP